MSFRTENPTPDKTLCMRKNTHIRAISLKRYVIDSKLKIRTVGIFILPVTFHSNLAIGGGKVKMLLTVTVVNVPATKDHSVTVTKGLGFVLTLNNSF